MDECVVNALQPKPYRCPGEAYAIDRAVHLARLAAYYPACRDCASIGTTRMHSSPLQVRQLGRDRAAAAIGRRVLPPKASQASRPTIWIGQLCATFAVALGDRRLAKAGDRRAAAAVLVGADGHWTTAELVAAACEGLQLSWLPGHRDRRRDRGGVGAALGPAPSRRRDVDRQLAAGEPHAHRASSLGPRRRALVVAGQARAVRQQFERPPLAGRTRRGGGLRAVRGQRRLPDSACSLCFMACGRCGSCSIRPASRWCATCDPLGGTAPASVIAPRATAFSRCVRRARAIRSALCRAAPERGREQVLADGAHFGLWIDGDGECLPPGRRRGAPVDSEAIGCGTLADYILPAARQRDRWSVERAVARHANRCALEPIGRAASCGCDGTRQASVTTAMRTGGAVLGGGPERPLLVRQRPARSRCAVDA